MTPTLNAAKVLEDCLRSIREQDYPQELVEIIIADGGSTDNTLEIAQKYGAKILSNKLRTGESGKAVALRYARNDLVALIDSDNILPQRDWFRKMVEPFNDPEVLGSEPIEYTWRKEDGFITRYCALIGMNDPLVMFLGNYDRFNHLTGKWTELELEEEDRGSYLVITLGKVLLPTIGANGTLLRKKLLDELGPKEYFFDIDAIYELSNKGSVGNAKFAKVKLGIVHLYCESSVKKFVLKQRRRVKDYLYYENLGIRKYPWRVFGFNTMRGRGLLLFTVYTTTVAPLVFQSILGYRNKRDWAWFFHPPACLITLWVYSTNWLVRRIFSSSGILDREGYSQ